MNSSMPSKNEERDNRSSNSNPKRRRKIRMQSRSPNCRCFFSSSIFLFLSLTFTLLLLNLNGSHSHLLPSGNTYDHNKNVNNNTNKNKSRSSQSLHGGNSHSDKSYYVNKSSPRAGYLPPVGNSNSNLKSKSKIAASPRQNEQNINHSNLLNSASSFRRRTNLLRSSFPSHSSSSIFRTFTNSRTKTQLHNSVQSANYNANSQNNNAYTNESTDENEVSILSPEVLKPSFNLMKNVLGAGVLSLSYGVAAFTSNKRGLIFANMLTLFMGALSGYCFALIARICDMNQVNTYKEVWDKRISPKTSWLVTNSCTFKTFFACLSYSIIIGDAVSSLLSNFPMLPPLITNRSSVIVWMTTFILYPLCSLKTLDRLVPFSIAGLFGVFFTAAMMLKRFLDGSYLPGGKFFSMIPVENQPLFSSVAPSLTNPMNFVLLSMLSTAYIAHYNAPKFYSSMPNRTVKKLEKVVTLSYSFITMTFMVVLSIGFLTFGGNAKGLVLNNYSSKDLLIKLCRVAVCGSIVTGYPLNFVGARDGFQQILEDNFKVKKFDERKQNMLSAAILAIVSILAIVLTDLGFVVSFGGAILGSAIIYIFPTILFIKTIKDKVKSGELDLKVNKGLQREVYLNYVILGLGIVFAVIGGGVSILKQFFGW